MSASIRTAHCPEHGNYESRQYREDKWTQCPACLEARRAAEDAARRARCLRDDRRKRMQTAWRDSGVPAKFHRARVSALRPPFTGAVDYVRRAIRGETRGPLILVGGVGTGKTHCAVAAARVWIAGARYCGMRFTTQSGFCAAVRATWNRQAERTEDAVIDYFARASLLVLDDLGAGKPADLELLQTLVCARYDSGLMNRTVITTNLSAKSFDSALGQRVADRFREGAELLIATGPSLRRPVAGSR